MKNFVFIFVLFFAAFSSVSGQKDSADNEESTDIQNGRKSSENTKNNAESKTLGKNNGELQRPNSDFLITPDDRIIFNPNPQSIYYPDGPNDRDAIPNLGFSNPGNQRHSFFLSDNTGRYNVIQLQNFRQPKPSTFGTAVGAISAHILNQGTNQEYIPYPPNGDPYNYPAYRGYPHATEPPVVRAYEMATHSNYGVQPSANYDQYSSRRYFTNNGYHQGFANQFDNFGVGFYNNPYDFNQGLFYSGFRKSDEQIYQDGFPDNQRDYSRQPIKRYV